MNKKRKDVSEILNKTKNDIRTAPKKIIEFSAKYNIGLGFWIFVILTFVLGILFFSNIENFMKVAVQKYGYLGIFFTTFFAELVIQPVGPDVPLIAGILLKLNPWLVLCSVLAGAYIAIIVSYYIGKKIGLPGIERIMGTKNFEKIKKYEKKGKWFLLIGALTPVPYIPYLAGVWKLSFKDTLIYVALPRTVRLVFVFALSYFLGLYIFN